MTKRTVGFLIMGIAAFLAASLLIQIIYRYHCRFSKQAHHEEISVFINDEITYEPEELDDELARIEKWIQTKNVTDADLGHLYERESNIYKFQGDLTGEYRAMGYAFYYLEKGGDYEYSINMYLDLATSYLVNMSYANAVTVVEHVESIMPLSDISDLQIKSYAYRMKAILCYHEGQYEDALDYLQMSEDTVNLSDTNLYEDAYRAMIDVNRARVYIGMGEYDKARQIQESQKDSPLFTQTIFADVLARDFVIPYYENECFLAIETKDNALIKECIDQYISICEEFAYRKIELDTLIRISSLYPPNTEKDSEEFYTILNRIYSELMEQQNSEYTLMISDSIDDSISTISMIEDQSEQSWKRVQTYVMYIVFILLLLITIYIIVYNSRRDGLTKVLNRRDYERAISAAKRSGLFYSVILMDIDDFKHINDTYGHPKGDEVLKKLGTILKRVSDKSTVAYRYGGEEFAMIVSGKSAKSAYGLAEMIRRDFGSLEWDFKEQITISMGVAGGSGEDDVLKRADENLYHSKRNGKNQVTSIDFRSN